MSISERFKKMAQCSRLWKKSHDPAETAPETQGAGESQEDFSAPAPPETPRERQDGSAQGGTPQDRLAEVLSLIEERNAGLARQLQTIADAGGRQTELLEAVVSALADADQKDSQTARSISQLAEALDNANRSNAAHVEVIEQIRDRLLSANDEFDEIMRRHSRRTTWLLAGVLAMLAVVAAAIAVHGVMVR